MSVKAWIACGIALGSMATGASAQVIDSGYHIAGSHAARHERIEQSVYIPHEFLPPGRAFPR